MSLKNKIVSVVIILLITTIIIIQNNKASDKQPLDLVNKSYDNFSSMKSIAKPNWWIKPKISSTASQKSTKIVKSNAEPISNFMTMPDMEDWQLQGNRTGIASAIYVLNDTGNQNTLFELAIIRMNSQVALEAVLSIWQSKAGLTAGSLTKSMALDTQQKQRLELFTFKGEKKTILVAVHKAEKYTFFRLSSAHSNIQHSGPKESNKMEITFKELLANVYIYNK